MAPKGRACLAGNRGITMQHTGRRLQWKDCEGERIIIAPQDAGRDLWLTLPLCEFGGYKCKAMDRQERMYILDKEWLGEDVTNGCYTMDADKLPVPL